MKLRLDVGYRKGVTKEARIDVGADGKPFINRWRPGMYPSQKKSKCCFCGRWFTKELTREVNVCDDCLES